MAVHAGRQAGEQVLAVRVLGVGKLQETVLQLADLGGEFGGLLPLVGLAGDLVGEDGMVAVELPDQARDVLLTDPEPGRERADLDPETAEEVALARTERKTGPGYRGFVVDSAPSVTLEDDLQRRDLTINAMARAEDGTLIDPFGGRDDLDAGLLRHVSPAFVEDPLRVLRVARFAARLGPYGFRVAHPTQRLLHDMVKQGQMAHVRRERLWREMAKAMAAPEPWRFFEVLQRCGALAELIPPLADALGEVQAHRPADDSQPIAALKRVSAVREDAPARLAAVLLPCVASVDDADALLRQLRADRNTGQLLGMRLNECAGHGYRRGHPGHGCAGKRNRNLMTRRLLHNAG